MLVHGIDVEQVELHLADDPGEGRNIGRQHAIAVHLAQHLRQASGLAENLHEQVARARIPAEAFIDQVRVAADQADGGGAHPFEFRVLLQYQEQLQQGEGIVFEDLFVAHFQEALDGLEALVDDHRLGGLAGMQDDLAEQLQQHFIEAVEFLYIAVVIPHEDFHRLLVVAVPVAEDAGEGALVIKQQAVLAPAGVGVQGEAHAPQEGLPPGQRQVFQAGEEAVLDQLFEPVGAEVVLGHPAHHVDVAQPAGAFLDIGFQLVGGVVKAGVARLLFLELGGEELLARPEAVRRGGRAHGREQARVAGEEACLDQVGHHRDVLCGLYGAFRGAAHAVAHFQADVPQEGQEALQVFLVGLVVGAVRQQDQQVDVGAGQQLVAPVAAHRHQGQLGVVLDLFLPAARQQPVYQPAQGAYQIAGIGAGGELLFQGFMSGLQRRAVGADMLGGGRLRRRRRQREPLRMGGGRGGGHGRVCRLRSVRRGGGSGLHGPCP